MKLSNKAPILIAAGSALASGLTSTTIHANTFSEIDSNPFEINALSTGYMQTAEAENETDQSTKMEDGSCGEGRCGGDMSKGSEEKTSEGACAGNKPMPEPSAEKTEEGKCGEGKCGGSM